MRFNVIGITDHPHPFFPPEVQEIIWSSKVFSGGKRHHEIVAPLLPKGAEWVYITVPLERVFEQYRLLSSGSHNLPSLTVFASGDPLFFGFANTLKREFPDAEIELYPSFNSLQILAHRLLMPYHDMRVVSLTGRPWPAFDCALIERVGKLGILTDREHTPAAIAQRMLYYGYNNYIMYVGEHLGNPSLEKVMSLSLEEAAASEFRHPNCVIVLRRGPEVSRPFGLPDSAFSLLDGREKMITKMPIRLLTLQALDLSSRHVFWDIGFCTGSVSIEARLQFPHLQIEAFEIRPECESIIRENARRFGAPGIGIHIGDFRSVSLDSISTDNSPVSRDVISTNNTLPDAVFIGGHGGRLKEIMAKVLTFLAPNGIIVMNSVIAPKVVRDSHQLWNEACEELGLTQDPPMRIQLNDNHPITILRCRK